MRVRLSPSGAFASAVLLLTGVATSRTAAAQSLTGSITHVLQPAMEVDYEAGKSQAAAAPYALTATCAGGGNDGCTVRVGYATTPLLNLEWRVVAVTRQSQGNANCTRRGPTVFSTLTAGTSTDVITSDKNAICLVTMEFRVRDLSYRNYTTAGGSTGTLQKDVTFTMTRP